MKRIYALLEGFAEFALWLIVSSLLAVMMAGPAHAQTPGTLTFTLETSSNDGKSVVPRLTWQTTPAGATCAASGASDWTGTKAAAGTVLLAAVTQTRTYSLACTWPGATTATVAWTPPTQNTDGSAYTNANGYRIQWGNVGPAESQLNRDTYIADSAARSWTSPTLSPGTWWFGVKAVNAQGIESAISNVGSKVATAPQTVTRNLELTIRFPNPPVITVE